MQQCPCQSGKSFAECCQPYVTFTKAAPTPEALMRSRYTAYTLANIDYIQQTMKDPIAASFNYDNSLKFAKESEWVGLDIIRSYQPFDTIGYVEFVAHFNDYTGEHQHLAELSEFHLEDGRWYYVDGTQEEHHHDHHHHDDTSSQPIRYNGIKLGRNDPCYCGSGKKYKKCCGV
ncbi:MAG: YchJ family protein [Gammaproteobacteria bacterium]